MVTTKISLKGYASYSAEAVTPITLQKPVAVLYGHNGSGKTSIARLIRAHGKDMPAEMKDCSVSIDGIDQPELFIYDADYVEENFHAKDGMRGIFTLGEKSGEEVREIEALEKQVERDRVAGAIQKALLQALLSEADDLLQRTKDACWSVKERFDQTALRFCLEKYKLRGDKARLFQHLLAIASQDGDVDLDALLREADELLDSSAGRKDDISLPNLVAPTIEEDALWAEEIVGSEDSRLSPLISALRNQNWVARGVTYLDQSQQKCPFCQQGLPHDFAAEVANIFDNSYNERVRRINLLASQYRDSLNTLRQTLASPPFQDEYVTSDAECQRAIKDLELAMARNLEAINSKLSVPAEQVKLEQTSGLLQVLMSHLGRLQSDITTYNARLEKRDQSKELVISRFWKKMRFDYDAVITSYITAKAELDTKAGAIEVQLQALRDSYMEAQSRLRELRASSNTIEAAVDAINLKIKQLGVQGFQIEKDEANKGYYRISRGERGRASYKSLSEGEKTLITMIYFLESLNGAETSDGTVRKGNRVVVLDDPVSSLSHNHVYDIASLVMREVIGPRQFAQIIILTHSLFFYHELFKLIKPEKGLLKQCECFRVAKQQHSSITPMEWDEIKNDYQSYWVVVKESQQATRYSVALPIAMRYILEHYFGFVSNQQSLRDSLLALESSDTAFQPFYRFINRQSHGDPINISDLPNLDPAVYIAKFKEVFVRTDQLKHYEHMMDLDE
ncbi:AAA family ATPase [Frateuria terrea]|uniref:Wobble nucleotide-excising tRNase n=1 Tax=Frateuria terrea TaxID=529704 RepID=A0A1H6VZC6_9GAMM|nr:AAA family ATPase [Frateuria terrea]SEJ05552.1 Wobble nucleotide-excising tRNase [Frateuria terrea]SFP70985.1 Wobble nucleotide-excising tRNase [Frateuria terrea]